MSLLRLLVSVTEVCLKKEGNNALVKNRDDPFPTGPERAAYSSKKAGATTGHAGRRRGAHTGSRRR